MPSPDFSPELPGNGGNGQDRRIIEWSGNLSNRSPSFARLPSCVRSRDLWTRPRGLTEQVRLNIIEVYDILRLTAKAIQNSRLDRLTREEQPMIIVKVSALPMSAPVPKEKRHRTDLGTKVKSDATLIRVETDNGLTGIGAALGTPPIVAAIVEHELAAECHVLRAHLRKDVQRLAQ
jgi:hypothetical protein